MNAFGGKDEAKGILNCLWRIYQTTHRQEDFNAVKDGKPPIRLTKWVGKVTYILHWTLEDEETHARVSKLGLEQFYKRWNRCLTTMPKIILGENIV